MSPKKSKKEKKAAKVAVSVPDVVVKDSIITVTTDAKLESQPSGVEAELIAAMEDEVVTPQAEDTQKEAGDEMATKLSKNSRKKKTKESREKYAVCEAFVSCVYFVHVSLRMQSLTAFIANPCYITQTTVIYF